jgi:hypothetical protein
MRWPARLSHVESSRLQDVSVREAVFRQHPPGDFRAFVFLNDLVKHEPATVLDPELRGPLAALSIYE